MLRNFTCVAVLLCARNLFAWGGDGHEIVAYLAAQHLTDDARRLVFNLLSADSDTSFLLDGMSSTDVFAVADAMARAATWPDRVKKKAEGKGTGEWHFIDLASDEDASAIAGRCGAGGDCVTVKIRTFRQNIPAGTVVSTDFNDYDAAAQLKFLIHFVGDIHQPLHAATNADAGGNCIKTKGFGQSELHAVWDTGLVKPLKGTGGEKSTFKVALDLDDEFLPRLEELSALTAEDDIAVESHTVAFQKAYAPILSMLPDPEPRPFKKVIPFACVEAPDFKALAKIDVSGLYDDNTSKVVREQLAKGGYRLAAMLNALAPSAPPQ